MMTKVRKWGNSLAVRIPSSFARQARVQAGSTVDLSVQDGELVLKPVHRMYRLDDLLEQVSPDNLRGAIDTGEPVGRESW